jgi:hypothetical protein
MGAAACHSYRCLADTRTAIVRHTRQHISQYTRQYSSSTPAGVPVKLLMLQLVPGLLLHLRGLLLLLACAASAVPSYAHLPPPWCTGRQ